MTKFTDHLWSDLAREHGATLAEADRPDRSRVRLLGRPRVLAGGMLGLAGVGTALVLSLGASSPPAYAVTTVGDDSVLVTINQDSALPQANAKLTAMGIHEQVIIYMAAGPAAVSGPVTCTPAPGDDVSGPTLEVLVGNDATSSAAPASLGPMRTGGAPTWRRARVESPGQLAGNTGVGTFHLDHCVVTGDAGEGDSGNTGAG